MSTTLKRWTQLGLSAVMVSGTLTACGASDKHANQSPPETLAPGKTDTSQQTTPTAPPYTDDGAAAGEGEGEGGVSIARAATDPIVYGSALAITEAHIIAARDAFALGKKQAAGEMFAHPVSEVLFDMQPIFKKQGVEDFSELLVDASKAVFADETLEQINARADAIIAALRKAAQKAPENGVSQTNIAAGVVADQIDRAVDMYRIAMGTEAYEAYLDGYGFYKAAEAIFMTYQNDIAKTTPEAALAIKDAINLLEGAYPSAIRPEVMDTDVSLLTVAASKVLLTAQK